MAITKIVYVDGVTVIRAAQLNAWQDEMIRLDDVKYEKPADGIPKSDLAAALQTLLDKAQDVEEAAERGDFDGEDGVSPTITVEEITGGHRVTITSKAHPEGQTFDVLDGEDGEDGSPGTPGAPGVSPTVTVENITGGHRITITDATGTETFDVMDGEDGGPGATPDLQIGTVTTGEPGSAAEASITGTPEEPLLNLKLPRGQQGPAVPLSDATPLMDGTASAGTGTNAARADHVHPHDSLITNRNLLDNWYFVGGGSQLGYGVFPINQRGQTVYQTSGAYAIDRWKLNSGGSNLSATLNSDGVTLASENAQGDWCLIQELSVSPLLGKTVTASIKVESVNGRGYIHLYVNPTIPLGAVDITSPGVYSVTLTVPINTTRIRFVIGAPTSMVVSACKVEIGSTQTLAHQEAGVWVLNEIPDFGEELIACQHYAIVIPGTGVNLGYANSDTVIRISVPCPAQFVGQPSLAYGGSGFSFLRLIGNGLSLEPTAATASNAGNAIILEFTVSGATQNMPYVLKNNGTSILIFAS